MQLLKHCFGWNLKFKITAPDCASSECVTAYICTVPLKHSSVFGSFSETVNVFGLSAGLRKKDESVLQQGPGPDQDQVPVEFTKCAVILAD